MPEDWNFQGARLGSARSARCHAGSARVAPCDQPHAVGRVSQSQMQGSQPRMKHDEARCHFPRHLCNRFLASTARDRCKDKDAVYNCMSTNTAVVHHGFFRPGCALRCLRRHPNQRAPLWAHLRTCPESSLHLHLKQAV